MEYHTNGYGHRCEEIAQRLIARYDWQLLNADTFVHQICAAAAANPTADLSYIAHGVYNHALYVACRGDEGRLRWERGYYELYQMLCDRARYYYPNIWEDAVQGGIELTCVRITRCSVPQAFFSFAWGYVQNAARTLRQEIARDDLSIERTVGDDQISFAETIPDPQPNMLDQVVSDETRCQVLTLLAEFERVHRRAHKQLAALLLKFLYEEDEAAIGQLLGVPVKRVYELRALGKQKLRTENRLREIYESEE